MKTLFSESSFINAFTLENAKTTYAAVCITLKIIIIVLRPKPTPSYK